MHMWLQREEDSRNELQYVKYNDTVKIMSSITCAHMVDGILPGTFQETIDEMYEFNGLNKVIFPKYIPPPAVDPGKTQEEAAKMR